ncbi:MAG: metallophosphoesterase [Kofleriaceae bacterium]
MAAPTWCRPVQILVAAAVAVAGCGPAPGDGVADASARDGATPAYPPWTLVVLPDTQVYLDRIPGIWDVQTAWVAAHAGAEGVRLTIHVGDVTEWNSPDEWRRAAAGFAQLERAAPLVVVPGNHDYDPAQPRVSGLAQAWSADHLIGTPTFGGLFEAGRPDNHYQLLDINGQRWLVLALEWAPRPVVLRWAAQILDAVPADHVIVVTHAFLYNDDRPYDWQRFAGSQAFSPHSYVGPAWPLVTDGAELWNQVLAGRANVDLVVSGHVAVDGVGRAATRTTTGHLVHQVLQDYQGDADGGAGYLRLFRFFGDRIEVETYSPWLDRALTDARNRFTLPWSP